jgi:opacity protein-like surface antigen
MRKLSLLAALILMIGAAKPAMAQNGNAFSFYGGYYFDHASVSTNFDPSVRAQGIPEGNETFGFNFNGGGLQFAYNFNQDSKIKYGLVAEFSGTTAWDFGSTTNLFTFLGGPRVSFGNGKLLPFAQVLIGGAKASGAFSGEGGGDETAFALSAGGGLDLQLSKHWFVRPVQASYLMTRFGLGGSNRTQNSFQYSAGVGVRWP